MGKPDAVCLDFDFAVRALKRWADRRSEETDLVPDHAPERKQRMKSVPRYPNLMAVLGIDSDDGDQPDQPVSSEISDMMAAMLTNQMGWQGHGL